MREAKQALEAERAAEAKKIPRDRTERLIECRRRLRQDWGKGQIVLAAEISTESTPPTSSRWSRPRCASSRPRVSLRRPRRCWPAGYSKNDAIDAVVAQGIQILVAPDADRRKEPRPGRRGGRYDFARRVLATDWPTTCT